jgi:phasin family protein
MVRPVYEIAPQQNHLVSIIRWMDVYREIASGTLVDFIVQCSKLIGVFNVGIESMFNFEETSQKSKEAMDAMMQNYASVTKGFQAIATEAADFTKKSFEDSVAHAEKLAGVKSVEDAVGLQTTFVKSSFENFVSQATKMNEMYVELAKSAYKPFEGAMAQMKEAGAEMSQAA